MKHQYYVVQVEFLNKWIDLPGSKYHFDPTDSEEQKQSLESVKRIFASAQKRAKEYRHRILLVSVIEQTPNPDF
jgi:hypothetical protein